MEKDEWQSLLFENGHNPLDQIIDSSSLSEEHEESPLPRNVFQKQFLNRKSTEHTRSSFNSVGSRINRETAKFFVNELSSIIENEWQGREMEAFDLKVLQLNLSIFNMKTDHIEFSQIHFERGKNTLHLIALGGSAKIHGSYKSKFKTVRRGQVQASVHKLNVDLHLRFHRSQSRIFYLLEMDCKPSVERIDVKLEPFLLDEVQEAIEHHLWLSLQREICVRAQEYVEKTDAKFQHFEYESLFNSKVKLKIN